MVTQIKNKRLDRELKKVGLNDIALYKDSYEGCFYIEGTSDFTEDVLDYAESTTIYAYSFNQLSIENWIDDILDIWEKALYEYNIATSNKEYNYYLDEDYDF